MERFKERTKKALSFGARKLREQDAFGTPITINYKGEDSYKSACGGFITVAILMTLLIQFCIGFDRVL